MHNEIFNVFMTEEQFQRAVKVGTLRYNESIKRGCKQAYGMAGYDLDTDILGASGELAYCIYTNQPWSESVNTFKAPDVGANVQVRTTRKKNGRLIVRKRDSDDDLFVLVIADGKKFRVVGSILGKDAKNSDYLYAPNDRPPAWFVDQKCLKEIEDKRTEKEPCPECGDKGRIFIEDLEIYVDCSTCRKTKNEPKEEEDLCPECLGEGYVFVEGPDMYMECSKCGYEVIKKEEKV